MSGQPAKCQYKELLVSNISRNIYFQSRKLAILTAFNLSIMDVCSIPEHKVIAN